MTATLPFEGCAAQGGVCDCAEQCKPCALGHNGTWALSEDSGIPITVTQPDDPAYFLLKDEHTSTPTVYKKGCFICEDPEFAQMGLPLCRACPRCGGHIAADDCVCDDCDYDDSEPPEFNAA